MRHRSDVSVRVSEPGNPVSAGSRPDSDLVLSHSLVSGETNSRVSERLRRCDDVLDDPADDCVPSGLMCLDANNAQSLCPDERCRSATARQRWMAIGSASSGRDARSCRDPGTGCRKNCGSAARRGMPADGANVSRAEVLMSLVPRTRSQATPAPAVGKRGAAERVEIKAELIAAPACLHTPPSCHTCCMRPLTGRCERGLACRRITGSAGLRCGPRRRRRGLRGWWSWRTARRRSAPGGWRRR